LECDNQNSEEVKAMNFADFNDAFLKRVEAGLPAEYVLAVPLQCDMKECVICESLTQQLEYKESLLEEARLKHKVLKRKNNRERRRWHKLERYVGSLEAELSAIQKNLLVPIEADLDGLLSTYGLRDALLNRVQEVIEEWDDNVMNQVNADVFIADVLARNNVLENNVASFAVRNENLSAIVNKLKADKKRLTKEVFLCTIPFSIEITLEEQEETLDALTWHCLENDADVTKLAMHFELWMIDKGIDKELDDIVEAYRLC
jgi:DNA repair exonuclease SbcCD ATPase subunit